MIRFTTTGGDEVLRFSNLYAARTGLNERFIDVAGE